MENIGRACAACQGQGQIGRMSRKKKLVVCYEPCKTCNGVGVVDSPTPLPSPPSDPEWDADVAIIGCGIGGAALALALQHRGISAKVFERDADFAQRKQGYGLTMQQGAIALARLGIATAGTSSLSHVSFLSDGNVIGCYGRELDERAEEGLAEDEAVVQKSHKTRHNIQIPRQRLRAILVHRLRESAVEWGSKFSHYEEDGRGVTLHFRDRKPFRAGVLVGADGIFSPIRQQKFGHLTEYDLEYLDVIVMLGIVPNPDIESLHRRVTQTLDGETRIFTMPFTSSTDPFEEVDELVSQAAYYDQERFPPRSDVVMWQLSFRCSEEEARALGKQGGAALKAEALRRCGQWHYPIPDLLQRTDPNDITGYPAYDRRVVLDSSIGKGGASSRVVLIGDAAHCMSPFKGQGANQALVDAVNLAKTLSVLFGPFRSADAQPDDGLARALRRFEAEMASRAGEKVMSSRLAARFLHSKDALVVGNCVRSATSMEKKAKMRDAEKDKIDEERRLNAMRLFQPFSDSGSSSRPNSAEPPDPSLTPLSTA